MMKCDTCCRSRPTSEFRRRPNTLTKTCRQCQAISLNRRLKRDSVPSTQKWGPMPSPLFYVPPAIERIPQTVSPFNLQTYLRSKEGSAWSKTVRVSGPNNKSFAHSTPSVAWEDISRHENSAYGDFIFDVSMRIKNDASNTSSRTRYVLRPENMTDPISLQSTQSIHVPVGNFAGTKLRNVKMPDLLSDPKLLKEIGLDCELSGSLYEPLVDEPAHCLPDIVCLCGASMERTTAEAAYEGAEVWCDVCGNNKFNASDVLFHCPKARSVDIHRDGYDLCEQCAGLQIRTFIESQEKEFSSAAAKRAKEAKWGRAGMMLSVGCGLLAEQDMGHAYEIEVFLHRSRRYRDAKCVCIIATSEGSTANVIEQGRTHKLQFAKNKRQCDWGIERFDTSTEQGRINERTGCSAETDMVIYFIPVREDEPQSMPSMSRCMSPRAMPQYRSYNYGGRGGGGYGGGAFASPRVSSFTGRMPVCNGGQRPVRHVRGRGRAARRRGRCRGRAPRGLSQTVPQPSANADSVRSEFDDAVIPSSRRGGRGCRRGRGVSRGRGRSRGRPGRPGARPMAPSANLRDCEAIVSGEASGTESDDDSGDQKDEPPMQLKFAKHKMTVSDRAFAMHGNRPRYPLKRIRELPIRAFVRGAVFFDQTREPDEGDARRLSAYLQSRYDDTELLSIHAFCVLVKQRARLLPVSDEYYKLLNELRNAGDEEDNEGGVYDLHFTRHAKENGELCVFCMHNSIDCVMVDCYHMCACRQCASQWKMSCPICRSPISKIVAENKLDKNRVKIIPMAVSD